MKGKEEEAGHHSIKDIEDQKAAAKKAAERKVLDLDFRCLGLKAITVKNRQCQQENFCRICAPSSTMFYLLNLPKGCATFVQFWSTFAQILFKRFVKFRSMFF